MPNPFLSLILPVHNEESRLPGALKDVEDFFEHQKMDVEVLVVENGSSDRTLEIAREHAHRYSWVRVFQEMQRGKGLAVRRGMLEARGAYRMFCDVDFSMPVTEIMRFIPPMLDVDVAIASREAPGAIRYDEPAYRHVTGRVFNTIVRWTALPGIRDSQCGFKCFKAAAAEKIFPLQTLTGWSFDVEVLYIAKRLGFKILEVPIPWYFNKDSRIRVIQDSVSMASDLIAIRKNDRQGLYHP